jgi:2-polyprenyl-3-methyl-5-hydroxy-6-metoxy-1,4-benzoquinol methylase
MLEEYKGMQVNQVEYLDEANIRSDILVTKRILELLGDLKGKKVLELGCGNGKVARMLQKQGAMVLAVDTVSEQLIIAKEHSLPEIQYAQADFSKRGFTSIVPTGPYDLILSVMSIFYSSGDGIIQTLENVKHLLSPNGTFIIGTASTYRGLKKENFDYFKEQESGVVLPSNTNEPFVTRYIHLPLEFLMTECIKRGFRLSKFIEPRATEEEVMQNPKIITEQDMLRPDYLILEFKAPL